MTDYRQQLLDKVLALGLPAGIATVTPSDRPDLADYQNNAAFAAARLLKRSPADIACEIAASIDDPSVRVTTVSGFVNIRLTDEALATMLAPLVPRPLRAGTVLIDYGGPNIAKPMHVGHLRSIVIGDALAAIGRHVGHTVVTDVHYGDWGYQMGLLLAYSSATSIEQLEADYVAASRLAREDPDFKDRAHAMTLALQAAHPDAVTAWRRFVDLSLKTVKRDIASLGSGFDLEFGESDAGPYLDHVVTELGDAVRKSDGALVAGDHEPPLMLRNSAGGWLYAATDLATVIMRREMPDPPEMILYVVDHRQGLHFRQVFEMASTLTGARLEHISFGTVNGPDGKPFKTREGGVPHLRMLLDEAEAKAGERIADAGDARKVALAAIKFADLQTKRTGGYAFDLDRALAMEGRTGPYMLYQLARISSICEKASVAPGDIAIASPNQRALAIDLLGFEDAVDAAWEQRQPHLMAEYLYGLSQRFSTFYATDRVSDSPSNLALTLLVRDRLQAGLRLLGIETVTRM